MSDSPPSGIRIGELMRRAGVTRATVHHYVREGLLPEPVKTSRNMALYSPDCVDRVLLIKNLQANYRRSLAEVRELLDDAEGHEALLRLRERVTSAVPADFGARQEGESLSRDAMMERTGFPADQLDEFASRGVISFFDDGGTASIRDYDVSVVDALARLRDAGFDREHGFQTDDAAMYLTTLRDLLREEVRIFLERSQPGEDPEDLVARAERGIKHVTPLLIALRNKVIQELIDSLHLPDRT